MLNMAEKVLAGCKTTTQLNQANHNYLSNAWTMSKGQLIRQMEMMQMELNQKQKLLNKALDESLEYKLKAIELNHEIIKMQNEENPISFLRIAK